MTAAPLTLRGNADERFLERHRDTVAFGVPTPWESWFRRVECVVVIDSLVISEPHLARGGPRGLSLSNLQ